MNFGTMILSGVYYILACDNIIIQAGPRRGTALPVQHWAILLQLEVIALMVVLTHDPCLIILKSLICFF